MDTELKYVVTEHGDFAIFTKLSSHNYVARGLYGRAVGAGFCTIRQKADSEDVNVHCYGESTTLDLVSRPEDEELINRKINII